MGGAGRCSSPGMFEGKPLVVDASPAGPFFLVPKIYNPSATRRGRKKDDNPKGILKTGVCKDYQKGMIPWAVITNILA